MITPANFLPWLTSLVSPALPTYRHRTVKEDLTAKAAALPHLKQFLLEAHSDAREHIRAIAGIPLDPLAGAAFDPAAGYPDQFHEITLQGYFGEAMAGLLVQLYPPFNEPNWEVPVYLFRFHNVAFEQLELARQNGGRVGRIPGRTGSDCLAFRRSSPTTILRFLNCEAKCTLDHTATIIADAHEQVGKGSAKAPVSIHQAIEILKGKTDQPSKDWVEALRKFWVRATIRPDERYDLICYICGRSPNANRTRQSWLSAVRPHRKYTGRRMLEVVEIHLNDIRNLITAAYRP